MAKSIGPDDGGFIKGEIGTEGTVVETLSQQSEISAPDCLSPQMRRYLLDVALHASCEEAIRAC